MNKLFAKAVLSTALITTASITTSQANEFSIDINDTDVHVRYEQPIPTLQNYTAFGELLYSTEIEDVEIDGSVYSAGIILSQEASHTISFRVGGKATVLTIEDSETELALPIGGDITYNGETATNFYRVRGYTYIAPKILSFGDLERYIEVGVQGEYPFSNQLSGYVGYRNVNTSFHNDSSDADISNNIYIGGTFTF